MRNPLKHRSYIITEGRDRAPARSYYHSIGFGDEELAKPIVGIANTWIEAMSCNYHLRDLAERVKQGGCAMLAELQWSSTRSRSPTASRWEPRA